LRLRSARRWEIVPEEVPLLTAKRDGNEPSEIEHGTGYVDHRF
jgi:hypothetical protein